MPKRVKPDLNKIIEWKNGGATWQEVDKRRGMSSGNTKRWLKNNNIEVCLQPGIFYWVALDGEK